MAILISDFNQLKSDNFGGKIMQRDTTCFLNFYMLNQISVFI